MVDLADIINPTDVQHYTTVSTVHNHGCGSGSGFGKKKVGTRSVFAKGSDPVLISKLEFPLKSCSNSNFSCNI